MAAQTGRDGAPVEAAPAVVLPVLPEGLPESAQQAYDALRLFLRIRAGTSQRTKPEFTFAGRFVAEWWGLSIEQAKQGINLLRTSGVLVLVGKEQLSSGYQAHLYRLGPQAQAQGRHLPP